MQTLYSEQPWCCTLLPVDLTSLDNGVQHDPQNVSYVMCDTGIALYSRADGLAL